MYALILNNKVVQVSETQFPVSNELHWEDCTSDVKSGWFYDNGEFKSTLDTPEQILASAKELKVKEFKDLRDTKNIEPITSLEGRVITNAGVLTETLSSFTFYTKRHDTNPASDPTSVLSAVLSTSTATPYATKDGNGNPIIINLDLSLALQLVGLIKQKNNDNYRLFLILEESVNSKNTVEEIEALTWDESLLNPPA